MHRRLLTLAPVPKPGELAPGGWQHPWVPLEGFHCSSESSSNLYGNQPQCVTQECFSDFSVQKHNLENFLKYRSLSPVSRLSGFSCSEVGPEILHFYQPTRECGHCWWRATVWVQRIKSHILWASRSPETKRHFQGSERLSKTTQPHSKNKWAKIQTSFSGLEALRNMVTVHVSDATTSHQLNHWLQHRCSGMPSILSKLNVFRPRPGHCFSAWEFHKPIPHPTATFLSSGLRGKGHFRKADLPTYLGSVLSDSMQHPPCFLQSSGNNLSTFFSFIHFFHTKIEARKIREPLFYSSLSWRTS